MRIRAFNAHAGWTLALVLLASGCSGGDDDDQSDVSPSPAGDDDASQTTGDDDSSPTATPGGDDDSSPGDDDSSPGDDDSSPGDDDSSPGDDDSSPGDDDSSPGDDDSTGTSASGPIGIDAATVSESTPGAIVISYTLVGESGATFDLTTDFSTDGGATWKPASSAADDTLTGLEASPDGTPHTFSWATLADIGGGTAEAVFRLSGTTGGEAVDPATIEVSVDNTAYGVPCEITVQPPTQTDGQIPFTYQLSDAQGDVCQVKILVVLEGGPQPATASSSSSSDPLSDVEVPSTGITRHFVWDSAADIGSYDAPVTLKFVAEDAYFRDTVEVQFDLENSPAPDPGEVIFSEVLPWPDYGAAFIELYNTSHHWLDLSTAGLSSDAGSVYLNTEGLTIQPQSYLVLASEEAGWAQAVYAGFSMGRSHDNLTLFTGQVSSPVVLDAYSYTWDDFGGADAAEHSMSLMAGFRAADANDAPTAWCLEQKLMPDATDGVGDYGTPGGPASCDAD